MANTADSITTPTPPASRRRTLFAAAGAAIIGSGITAGAAASVADLVPPSAAAELIAIGTEARQLANQHHSLLGKWWQAEVGDVGLDQLSDDLLAPHDRLCELSEQALDIKASTPEAWRAKAEIVRHFLIVECETDGRMVFASSDQEIAWSLICDMTGRA